MALSGVVAVMLAACGGGGGDGGDHPSGPSVIQVVSGDAQTAVVGTELPVTLTVRVTDSSAGPSVGTTVTWSTASGSGAVTPARGTTDDNGTAGARWTLGTTAGIQRVSATVAGLPAAQFTATATAGAVSAVVVTSPSMQPYEGDSVQLVATVRDEFGNVVPGATVAWSSDDPERFPVSATGLLRTWSYGPLVVSAQVGDRIGRLLLQALRMELTIEFGAREVAHDWTTDRCELMDVIDGPARFVRSGDGSLVLFDGNAPNYYVSRGADFDSVRRDCSAPALVSALDGTPESYENVEWLWAVYREGGTWHALVHNEFHDALATTCQPGNPFPGNPCWYNSVTYAASTNNGHSFSKPGVPAHVVAPAPSAWVPPSAGPPVGNGFVEGYFNPSNIVRAADGYYYSYFTAIPAQNWWLAQGLCVMRTQTLGDPAGWRAWDGSGFNLRLTSPYVTGAPATVCTFLDTLMTHSHVVYNTYLERYMAVASGQGALEVDGRPTCGFFYALSADLVHWSEHRLLAEASLPWCPAGPGALEPVTVLYPSIVDHSDATVNFERAGRTSHFYYVRYNDGGIDRDLMRVPMTLTRTN
jgi:hypothetical protein